MIGNKKICNGQASTASLQLKNSGDQTVVGDIPMGWEVKKIIDISPLQRGFDLPTTLLKNGIYPVVYSNGILNYHINYKVRAPGVVTGRSGTIGKVTFVYENYWPHNTSLWVTDFKGNDPKFVYYIFTFIKLEKFGTGSGVPTLNRNDIHALKISLPPLVEQQLISEALGDVDALISELNALIVKKRNIQQGAMQQLLTGKKRLPGFTKKWEVKKLGEILKVRHGKSQHEVATSHGAYPILATGGEIGRAHTFLYDKPSVLIGRKGTIDVPQYIETPFWTIDTLFYTEIMKGTFPKYIFYKFKTIDWYLFNEASGVPSLNASTIEKIEVSHPEFQEQQAITEILSSMSAEIECLEQQRDKMKLIKQGMMQELLTGKTRLI